MTPHAPPALFRFPGSDHGFSVYPFFRLPVKLLSARDPGPNSFHSRHHFLRRHNLGVTRRSQTQGPIGGPPPPPPSRSCPGEKPIYKTGTNAYTPSNPVKNSKILQI